MVEREKTSFKHWLTRTVMIGIILLSMVYALEKYSGLRMFNDSIIAVSLVLMIGFLHEGLHYYKATSLGYKPRWFRTRFRVCFEISSHSIREKWVKDKKKIGLYPYFIILPISVVILVVGIIYQQLGLGVAGVGSLLMHGLSIKKEGLDVLTKRNKKEVEKK